MSLPISILISIFSKIHLFIVLIDIDSDIDIVQNGLVDNNISKIVLKDYFRKVLIDIDSDTDIVKNGCIIINIFKIVLIDIANGYSI